MLSLGDKKNIFNWLFYLLVFILLWASLWGISGDDALPPNGTIGAFFILFSVSVVFGKLVSLVKGIPPLFGMLVAGFLLRNFAKLDFDSQISSILRNFALEIIMLRAGLGLDSSALKNVLNPCLRLSIIPCLLEALMISITANLLLNFAWDWALLFGFVIAAVSPAVIVPTVLSLQEKGIGIEKGINILVIASSSITNVFVITAFEIVLSIVFASSDGHLWINIIKSIGAIFIGVAYGVTSGLLLWYFPKYQENDNLTTRRFIILVLLGTFSIYGSIKVNFSGVGATACVVVAFFASIKWRKLNINNPIQNNMKLVWELFCEPLIFGSIGAEMEISYFKGNIGLLILCFFIGLIIRLIATASVLWGAKLNLKEKLFIVLCWIPKATVQAAIGPIALDMARQIKDESAIKLGEQILTIAAFSIITTAPIGALALSLSSSKLLKIESKSNDKIEESNSIINNEQSYDGNTNEFNDTLNP